MSNLLDLVTIKFDLKLHGDLLARVTLNWQDEFEVRFCRLTMRSSGSLWFQPPALKEFGWAKCFAIPNIEKWRNFEKKVINEFIVECKSWVKSGVMTPEFYKKIKNPPVLNEKISEDDLEKINKAITNSNL